MLSSFKCCFDVLLTMNVPQSKCLRTSDLILQAVVEDYYLYIPGTLYESEPVEPTRFCIHVDDMQTDH